MLSTGRHLQEGTSALFGQRWSRMSAAHPVYSMLTAYLGWFPQIVQPRPQTPSTISYVPSYLFIMLAFTCFALLSANHMARADETAGATGNQQEPTVVEAPGTNVVMDDCIRPDYIVVDITTQAHNWWLMKLTGVKGKKLTIGFSMAGKGDVSKWTSLHPVYSYSDPDKLETFEWFTKDSGHWRSGNVFLSDEKRDAGIGKCPIQQAIPKDSTNEFLSKDGTYWEPWGRISNTQVISNINIFRFTQTFTQDTVWVAMRYPFSYTLLQNYIEAIRAKQDSRIRVNVVGTSQENRSLFAIEVKNSRFFLKSPETLLIYAREHATEPDGSWATIGILNALYDLKLGQWPSMIILPMVDPDSANANRYEGIIDSFDPYQSSKESACIMRYLALQMRDNQYIDISLNLHNVESGEANNTWMPHADMFNREQISLIKSRIEKNLSNRGYSISQTPPLVTFQAMRLEGWISKNIGSVNLIYELNSQATNGELTLDKLQSLGSLFVTTIDQSMLDDDWLNDCRIKQDQRRPLLETRWRLSGAIAK